MIPLTSINTGDYTLVALHKLAHTLCGYDVASGRELFRLATRPYPHELCLAPDRRRLYVTEYGLRGVESTGAGGTTIGVYDLQRRERVSTISTRGYERPHGVATHPSGYLFVTSETAGKLLIFDLGAEALLRAVDTGQELPHITNVAPDGQTVYAANIGSDSLTAIDVATGAVLQQIPALKRPEGMVFSPDGEWLYVVNRESDAIAIVDTKAQRMVGQIPTGRGPARIVITPDGERLAFPLFFADAAQVASVRTRQVTRTIPVGRQPAGAAMSRDGKLLFVSCELENAVYVISLDSYEVITKIATDEGPDSMVCLDRADHW
jgi:YVTN family beta-propeller protein